MISEQHPSALDPQHILFEDEHFIAVNKQSGILVHPVESCLNYENKSELAEEVTYLKLVRKHCHVRVFPVHRLDKATSGVLIFAKSPEIASNLCRQIEAHTIKKNYLALVRGWVLAAQTVNNPVWNEIRTQRLTAITAITPIEKFVIPIPHGKHSCSRYALISASPETGRYHQIRQHLKHISHPIIGDTTHGDGLHNTLFRAYYGVHRLFLHANSLEFMHPVLNEHLKIDASLPVLLAEVLQKLARETGEINENS